MEPVKDDGAFTKAVDAILDLYDRVAKGQTRGSGGSYYADGKGTLSAVHVPVELLEALAASVGAPVHPRVSR